MRAISYERKIPWGDEEIVYVISNGTRMTTEFDLEPDNATNESHPSLVVQAVDILGHDETANFLQALGEPEYGGHGQLLEEDIGEIHQVICGQPSNWKLTSMRFGGYGLCFDFRNFRRKRWKENQLSNYQDNYQDTLEGLREYHKWKDIAPPDHVWFFPTEAPRLPILIVKEFNKKGKVKRCYKIKDICNNGGEESREDTILASVEEYSKKHLERIITFRAGREKSYEIFAAITEFQY